MGLDSDCSYLDVDINRSKFLTQYIPNIRNFCKTIVPFICFYKNKLIIITEQLIKIWQKTFFDTANVSKR